MFVANVDEWYAELKSNGINVSERPNESIRGLRNMTVVDPDGNRLRMCTGLTTYIRKSGKVFG